MAAIALHELEFRWPGGATVLDVPAFTVEAGARVFLQGPSGSGKSTLLGLLAGVLSASAGSVTVLDQELTGLSGPQRDAFRAQHVGVVFQMFNLLPFLPVLSNVVLPCRFSAARARAAVAKSGSVEAEATRLLARLGLPAQVNQEPARALSVGQQQRVAAARALIGAPKLILADEPTSALDGETRDAFLKLLIEECEDAGATLVFVSHDASLAGHFHQQLDLRTLNRAASASQPSPAENTGSAGDAL